MMASNAAEISEEKFKDLDLPFAHFQSRIANQSQSPFMNDRSKRVYK